MTPSASTTSGEVARSPVDVLRLVIELAAALVAVVLEQFFGDGTVLFFSDLLRGFESLPSAFATALVMVVRLLTIAALVGGFAVALLSGRWRMLLTVVVAAVVAIALSRSSEPWSTIGAPKRSPTSPTCPGRSTTRTTPPLWPSPRRS